MSWMGGVGSGLGTTGGATLGYKVGGLPGAIVGGAIGGFAGGYGGDRAYEVVTGGDDEREKALQLLNMYLSPEDVQSVDRRIEMAQGGDMQPPQQQQASRPMSVEEQKLQAQAMMQQARMMEQQKRQQIEQAKAQMQINQAQMMMQRQGY